MKAVAKSVCKKLAYLLAGMLICWAILLAISRSVSPLITRYRPALETWATEMMQTPVSIHKIHIVWYRYQPGISLDKVTILSKDSKQPLLQVRQIRIFFSPIQSLWHFKPVTSGILLSGASLNISQTADGEIVLQGFPAFGGFNSTPYESSTKAKDVIAWLSSQERIMVNNIDIKYRGLNGLMRFVTLYNLSFNNSDDKHSISGKAILHQALPTEVNVTMQWLGKDFDVQKIRARAYLYVSGLSLSQWFKGLDWHNWQIVDGVGSTKLWLTWHDNALQKVQTTFELYGLQLSSATDHSIHQITRLSGNVGWKRDGVNQVIAGNDILLDLPNHLWPTTNFYLQLTPQSVNSLAIKTLNVGYVDLADVQSFLLASNFIDANLKNTLNNLHINGVLQSAVLTFAGAISDYTQTTLDATISQLSFSPWQKIPGIKNFSGEFKWNKTAGELHLNANQFIFTDNAVFLTPIKADQLSGEIAIDKNINQTWELKAAGLQLLSKDLAANVDGNLLLPENQSPVVDLKANFTLQAANHVGNYLPMKIFKPNLVAWLQHAFLTGEVKSGTAILRGALTDFPFENKPGLFQISGYVNNVTLKFAPDWPQIDKIQGQLTFVGSKMIAQVNKLEMGSIPITNVRAEIPYLGDKGPAMLNIQSDHIKTDFPHALAIIHASPLEHILGKVFNAMSVSGLVDLKLGLAIPLDDTDKTKVQGDTLITNTTVNLVPWQLAVNQVNGNLSFTEDTVQAQLQGMLFNKPVKIDLTTLGTKGNRIFQINLLNHVEMTDLATWLHLPITDYMTGDTDLNTKIDLALDKPSNIHLQSNLQGITINLPGNYAKTANDKANFNATITVDDNAPLKLAVDYGKLLNAAVILNKKDNSYALQAANIRFGEGVATWPAQSGLYLSGELDTIDWDKVAAYNNQTGTQTALPLRDIDLQIKKINFGSQILQNTRVQVKPSENNLLVNLYSNDIIGQIQIPRQLTPKGSITGQFARLNIHSAPKYLSNSTAKLDPKTLPSIDILANNVSYDDAQIGQVTLKAQPVANGLDIQTLRILSPRMNLQASGSWLGSGTSLHGRIGSNHVSDLLSTLGLGAHNFVVDKGSVDFDLNWNGALYAPDMATLNGSARLNLGEGRIVDIGQGTGAKMDLGRLLSIFSLQTLPRRLSLDFSDVFEKGYSFDNVKGDFSFKKGNIYTDHLHIEGPVAKVSIAGRIGLIEKDINLILTVNAHVTSSIPVAATLLTGQPLIGLAALAVNTVIGSQMSKAAATYYYSVTGSWDDPEWKSIPRNKTRA